MGRLDNAAKILLRGSPETAVALAFPDRTIRRLRAEDAETPKEPTRGDKLFRVELEGDPVPRWLHVEVSATWESDVPRRVHGYWSGFHKLHAEVSSLVLVLQRGNKKGPPRSTYEVTVGGQRRLWFSFDVVKAWELDAAVLLESGRMELLPLIPFASGATSERTKAAFRRLERVRGERKREDLQVALATFAGYVFHDDVWLDKIPLEVQMKNSFLDAIEQRGRCAVLKDFLEFRLGRAAGVFTPRLAKASLRKLSAVTRAIAGAKSKKALVKVLDELLPEA